MFVNCKDVYLVDLNLSEVRCESQNPNFSSASFELNSLCPQTQL